MIHLSQHTAASFSERTETRDSQTYRLTLAMVPEALDLASVRAAYASQACTPSSLISAIYPKLQSAPGVFLHLISLEALLERCQELEGVPEVERGSLWGIPFAVKDNVDLAGTPTTAACPEFSYMPAQSAPAVSALIAAGKAWHVYFFGAAPCRKLMISLQGSMHNTANRYNMFRSPASIRL